MKLQERETEIREREEYLETLLKDLKSSKSIYEKVA